MDKQRCLDTRTVTTRGIAALLTAVIIMAFAVQVEAAQAAAKYTTKGELIMPKNFRQWVFVGAPVTPNDMNDGKAAFPEFHHVYINPASFASYKKTGASSTQTTTRSNQKPIAKIPGHSRAGTESIPVRIVSTSRVTV